MLESLNPDKFLLISIFFPIIYYSTKYFSAYNKDNWCLQNNIWKRITDISLKLDSAKDNTHHKNTSTFLKKLMNMTKAFTFKRSSKTLTIFLSWSTTFKNSSLNLVSLINRTLIEEKYFGMNFMGNFVLFYVYTRSDISTMRIVFVIKLKIHYLSR